MNSYDTMSVDDLVLELIDELLPEEVSAIGTKTPRYEEIESALRRKVIEEASVGVVKLSHNGVASDYDIVPHKETP